MRFDRNFILTVGLGSQAATIRPPMRVVFKIEKNGGSGGLNSANIQIYNLKDSTRSKLFKSKEEQTPLPVELQIGYGDDLGVIFRGSVQEGTLQRNGPDFISTLQCLDGGDTLYSFTSATVRSKDAVFQAATKDMPRTKRGKITPQKEIIRPRILVGNSLQIITDNLNPGEKWFIDNEKLNILKDNEVLSSYIPVVSARTGLKNTPKIENLRVEFDTLMNPSLKIGHLCRLESLTAGKLNGIYKLDQMTYNGDNYGDIWGQTAQGLLTTDYKVI